MDKETPKFDPQFCYFQIYDMSPTKYSIHVKTRGDIIKMPEDELGALFE